MSVDAPPVFCSPHAASDTSHFRTVWDVPVRMLAEQMTFMDWYLYHSIPLSEFLANGWDRPKYEHTADSIMRFIDRVNAMCLWVEGSVLQVHSHCCLRPLWCSGHGCS